jgi:hypothetical protein
MVQHDLHLEENPLGGLHLDRQPAQCCQLPPLLGCQLWSTQPNGPSRGRLSGLGFTMTIHMLFLLLLPLWLCQVCQLQLLHQVCQLQQLCLCVPFAAAVLVCARNVAAFADTRLWLPGISSCWGWGAVGVQLLLVLMTAALNDIPDTSEVALLHLWLLNYAATAIDDQASSEPNPHALAEDPALAAAVPELAVMGPDVWEEDWHMRRNTTAACH